MAKLRRRLWPDQAAVRAQAGGGRSAGNDEGDGLAGEPAVGAVATRGHAAEVAVAVDADQQRAAGAAVVGQRGEPSLRGAYRAGVRVGAPGECGDAADGVAVGLGGAQGDLQSVGGEREVGDVQGGELAASGAEGEAEYEQCVVADAGGSAAVEGGDHGAQRGDGDGAALRTRMPASLVARSRR
ncbi:hypothetical protein ACX27O_15290 [Micromonospora sp. SD19]